MIEESHNNRIRKIVEAVRKAVEGDYSSHIKMSGVNDELDMIASAINQIIKKKSKPFQARNQTAAALKDRENKYHRLEANIPGIVYVFALHPDGTYSFPYVNNASNNLYNLSPEDIMRDANLLLRLIHPDDYERFARSVKQSAENLTPWREALRHVVNGEVRWYDYISLPALQPNGDIYWDGIGLEITDRMKAIESLKESEKQLSNIISESPVGIAIYDGEGNCNETNESMAQIIGTNRLQVLTQNYNTIKTWKKSGLLDQARSAIKTQSEKRHEVVTTTSFGRNVSLDCHLVPFGARGLLIMAQDITERKQAEDGLQKALKSLTNSQKLAKVGNWDWDLQKGEVEWSDEVYRIFGLDPDQFQPQIDSIMERFHPEDRKLHEVLITQAINDHEQYSFEARIILPDGETRYLLSTSEGCFDESGKLIQISGTVQDINERKQVEEELRHAKEYSEKLIETANAMIVVLDAEDHIKVFNKTAEEITGYTFQEVIGGNWFELFVPKDKYPNVWDAIRRSPQERLLSSFENPILTKTGDERFITWRNTELFEKDVFVGSISYGIDITKRKQLEEQLLQTQKMEAIGQLAGGVAHDFNNMLSVILGHAELLISGLPAGNPCLKNALEIEKASLHSRDITRQLLSFSRKQIISPKTINLNQLITHISKTLSQLIGENIDLRFIPEKDLWNVRFDPLQIDQILINLAVNSRDAIQGDGVVTIETSNVHLDEAYCALNVECRPGYYVLLELSDDGAGMDKEKLSHVFEPFYTTKEVGKGTGLGLSTVYGIVKQSGGFINIYSEPGKGATFKIYIPRLLDEVDDEKMEEEAHLELNSGTILLVEDDDMVRTMTAAILKKIGYTVVTAENPEAALAIFENEYTHLDLMITDVVMPQMSGAELTYKVNKVKPGLKVLYMSGYTENVIVCQGVLKEGIHFIQKPFSMSDFAKKIREAIED